jgi:muramidase (phage lysozyme)
MIILLSGVLCTNTPPFFCIHHSISRFETEAQTKFRLKVVNENEKHEDIEERIGQGQVEELLEHANNILALIPLTIKDRTWEEDPDDPTIQLWLQTESVPVS